MKIPEIPQLPQKEEREYKQKEFFLSIYEQFQASSKTLLFFFLGTAILAIPVKFGLNYLLVRTLIAAYDPPQVNTIPYTPQNLEVLQVKVLPVNNQRVSLIAQILNPNSEISAYSLKYGFILEDENGKIVGEIFGESFIGARESKFLFEPIVSTNPLPASAKLSLDNILWTKRTPADIKLEILQKNSGLTLEGNFFVEGLVKNSQGFGLKKVDVNAIVFDQANQNIVAVNKTVLTDIKPFESRYFRMIWPTNFIAGEVQAMPSVNLLDPGLILEKSNSVPIR